MSRRAGLPFVVASAIVLTIVPLASPGAAGGAAGSCKEGPIATAAGALDPRPGRLDPIELDGDHITTGVGRTDLTVVLEPLTIAALAGGERYVVREIDGGSLYLKRGENAEPVPVTSAEPADLERCGLALDATFADGTRGRVTIAAHGRDTFSIELVFDDPTVTHWGERLVTTDDELVYGLTERIVDDFAASEIAPQEVGSLDRKGEIVEMYVRPTISAYAPYYHSSNGYGLLVDGTMPGVYDLGATDPGRLGFEFELDPQARAARYFVFVGDHYAINDAYSRLTGRPDLPPPVVFKHWRGRDEAVLGPPIEIDGVPVNPTVADDLEHYAEYGIPPGVYHFDRPWGVGTEGYGDLVFDEARFPDPDAMLQLMRDLGWQATVWVSEWALDGRAAEAREEGWLAPGSEREIDLTNPDAVRWLHDDLTEFLTSGPGRHVDGFFVDRTEEIVPSESNDVFADGRNGRQLHNQYPVLMQRIVRGVLDDARGSDGWAIARAAYTGSARYTMTWGGDTRSREGIAIPEMPDGGASTDLGLRSVLISLQRAAFLGLPFWGSDIGGYSNFGDREVFARWIEVGAASPLMRFHGKGTDAPWDMPTEPRFDQEVLDIYRRYVELHHALVPYLVELSKESHRTGAPVARPLVYDYPDDPEVADRWDEWLLGDDLLVAPVWKSGERSRAVYLPRGRWVDFWDRDTVVAGGKEITVDVPLDRLPLYVKRGSPLLRDRELRAVTAVASREPASTGAGDG